MLDILRAFQPKQPQIALSEDDIRRFCGGAFERADLLQREGHVIGASSGGDRLSASVRGIWRRAHLIMITVSGSRITPSCDRDGATFCPHVGAVLLHWLRAPDSFTGHTGIDDFDDEWDDDFDEFGGDAWDELREPLASTAPQPASPSEDRSDEMAGLLESHTVAQLREIARRRGVRISGSKRADIVRQLAMALAEPENVDAALAELSADDQLLLDTIGLLSISAPAPGRAIPDAARMLGLPVTVKVNERLLELTGRALLGLVPGMGYGQSQGGYVIPDTVSARLPIMAGLLPESKHAPTDSHASRSQLDLMELLLVIVHDLERRLLEAGLEGTFNTRAVDDPFRTFQYAPPGFRIHPAEDVTPEQVHTGISAGQRPFVRIGPTPPLLREDVLARIASRSGQPTAEVAFAGELMFALQIPVGAGPSSEREERLLRLLEIQRDVRSAMFASAWYTMLGSAESWLLFSDSGRLRLNWQPSHRIGRQALLDPLISAIRLIAHIIGRLASDVTFEMSALTRQVIRLAPAAAPLLAQFRSIRAEGRETSISIVENGSERELSLSDDTDWECFVGAIVDVVVSGPLHWLGFVDVGSDDSESGASWFRVRPIAGVLAGRDVPPSESATPEAVRVESDLSVFVPSGTTDPTVHALLARIGDLVEGSADGLRYRLTPAGARDFFDIGVTGEQLVDALERRSDSPLPAPVRETIDRWWSSFGTIRLYDELTLIELSEDVLLHELRATTSLGSAVLHAFSPRVIAVALDAVDRLIDELTTRGYAPRVIEDS